jgi:hypothetical protein
VLDIRRGSLSHRIEREGNESYVRQFNIDYHSVLLYKKRKRHPGADGTREISVYVSIKPQALDGEV